MRILVDVRDHSVPVKVEARPAFRDSNRYHGYVSLKRLTDRRSGKASVMVAQALGRSPGAVTDSESDLVPSASVSDERLHPTAARAGRVHREVSCLYSSVLTFLGGSGLALCCEPRRIGRDLPVGLLGERRWWRGGSHADGLCN